MYRNTVIEAVLFMKMLFLCMVLTGVAVADDDGSPNGKSTAPCERAARDMLSACKSGVRDDLHTTHANCRSITDGGERKECFVEARQTRKEEAESCRDVLKAREGACELLGENRYQDPLLDPDIVFIDPDQVPGVYPPNPYVSVAAGHTYVLRAGEEGEETVVVHVTDETRDILGVACRVVLDEIGRAHV